MMTSPIDERFGTGLLWTCIVGGALCTIAAIVIGIVLADKRHTKTFITAIVAPFVVAALACATGAVMGMARPGGDYVDHGFVHDRYVPKGFDSDVLSRQYGLIHIDSVSRSSGDGSVTYVNKGGEQFSSCQVIHREVDAHTMAVSRVVCDQKDRDMRPASAR